jgi:acetylornithine deacetylase
MRESCPVPLLPHDMRFTFREARIGQRRDTSTDFPGAMALSSTNTAAVDFLKALVRIPSLTGEEAAIAGFVEQHVRRAGVDVLRHEDNVAFGIGEGDDTLLLNSHLDTAGAPWTRRPAAPR